MPGLYILLDPASMFIKIGRTNDLETRLANLRTGNPRLQLVHWYETPHDVLVESYVHAKLVAYRENGEFFNVSTEVAALEVADILAMLDTRPEQSSIDQVRQLNLLIAPREPNQEEIKLMRKIIDLKSKIKTLKVQEEILSDQLVVLIGETTGLNGWASFNVVNTLRFDSIKYQKDYPELVQPYLKSTYTRILKVRPGLN